MRASRVEKVIILTLDTGVTCSACLWGWVDNLRPLILAIFGTFTNYCSCRKLEVPFSAIWRCRTGREKKSRTPSPIN